MTTVVIDLAAARLLAEARAQHLAILELVGHAHSIEEWRPLRRRLIRVGTRAARRVRRRRIAATPRGTR